MEGTLQFGGGEEDDGEDGWTTTTAPQIKVAVAGSSEQELVAQKEEEEEEESGFDAMEDEYDPAAFNLPPQTITTRTYDLSITYDKYWQTPRMWLCGYDEVYLLL